MDQVGGLSGCLIRWLVVLRRVIFILVGSLCRLLRLLRLCGRGNTDLLADRSYGTAQRSCRRPNGSSSDGTLRDLEDRFDDFAYDRLGWFAS